MNIQSNNTKDGTILGGEEAPNIARPDVCPLHQAPIVADLMRGPQKIRPLCVTCVVEHTYNKAREGQVQLRLL